MLASCFLSILSVCITTSIGETTWHLLFTLKYTLDLHTQVTHVDLNFIDKLTKTVECIKMFYILCDDPQT